MSTNQIPENQHNILLQTAIDMTTTYRQNREEILADEFKGQNILPKSETFNKDAFVPFFNNEDCKALRIYYGMDEDLKVHAVVVGVNEANEDMLPAANITETEDPNMILELATRCPPDPDCPPSSPLNTP